MASAVREEKLELGVGWVWNGQDIVGVRNSADKAQRVCKMCLGHEKGHKLGRWEGYERYRRKPETCG